MSQENVEIVRGVYEHFDATQTVDLGRIAPLWSGTCRTLRAGPSADSTKAMKE
jgi:hypothetical protein